MKGFPLVLGAVTIALAGAQRTAAQEVAAPAVPDSEISVASARQADPHRRLARGDVTGVLGWFNLNKSELDSHNDWLGRSVFGGAGAGWYWTDHLKAALEFGATSHVEIYTATPVRIAGTQVFLPTSFTFTTRRVTLGQLYQFGRNEWFHPFAGGGLDVVWERTKRVDEYGYYFDPVLRQSQLVRDRVDHQETTDVEPRAFLSSGFKAYLSRRAFFLLDGRVTFARRPEEILIRIGFGSDF